MSTENKCCAFCTRETLHDDTNSPECTDPNCPCHTPHQKDTSDPVERAVDAIDDIMAKYHLGEHMYSIEREEVVEIVKAIQDGERERLNEAIPFVLDTLNEINLKGKLEYADYSRLHDEISALNTNSQ